MEPTRATWTDERLDDLSKRVDDGFSRVDEDLRALRGEVHSRTDELSRRIDALDVKLSGRIDALQRTMVQFGGGLTLAVLATLVSVLATRA